MNDAASTTEEVRDDFVPHDAVSKIINAADGSADRMDFLSIEAAILEAHEALHAEDPARLGVWADSVAFALEPKSENDDPWRRYFGPRGYASREGNVRSYIPPVDRLDIRAIRLWSLRLQTVSHPVLRARYADLLWELATPVGRNRPSRDHAASAIAAYRQMAEEGLTQSHFERHDAGLRMLTLAMTVNDMDNVGQARDILLDLHRAARLSERGVELAIVDGLLGQRRRQLEASVAEELIGDLEAELDHSVSLDGAFSIGRAEAVANRLRLHYSRNKALSDLRRVHARLAGAFEALAARGSALAATSHLDRAAIEYDRAGDKDNASRVRIGRSHAVERSAEEMVENSVEIRIGFDEMEAFLNKIVRPDKPVHSLFRIADMFPTLDTVANGVRSIAAAAPIYSMMPFSIIEDEHVAAIVGGIGEDMEGRTIHQAGQDSALAAFQLDAALERAVVVHGFDEHYLASWAARQGAFSDLTAVSEGIRAWFEGDWWKCLAVLTPQIEAGVRRVLKSLGGATVKDHPTQAGRQVLLNMGEVLASPTLQHAVGPDVILYFRSRYVDPRGRNLRNVVAHGLAGENEANSQTCDMLIQSLLLLGCWHTIAEVRQRRVAAGAGA